MAGPIVRRSAGSRIEMYAWPTHVKLLVMTLAGLLCLAAYGGLVAVVVAGLSLLLTLR